MRTKLEKILMIFLVLIAIGATLQGMKTLETINRLENATYTLSKIVCEGKEPTIDWAKGILYCQTEGKMVKEVRLYETVN